MSFESCSVLGFHPQVWCCFLAHLPNKERSIILGGLLTTDIIPPRSSPRPPLQNRADCSGRAIGGVHDDAYGDEFEVGADGAKKATGAAHATEA